MLEAQGIKRWKENILPSPTPQPPWHFYFLCLDSLKRAQRAKVFRGRVRDARCLSMCADRNMAPVRAVRTFFDLENFIDFHQNANASCDKGLNTATGFLCHNSRVVIYSHEVERDGNSSFESFQCHVAHHPTVSRVFPFFLFSLSEIEFKPREIIFGKNPTPMIQ